ncbi:hypothetical protein FGRMN_11217 [Fusarium graminum]|nr:hypothetical protein FGRMN_11217 [Fusarium graminum]
MRSHFRFYAVAVKDWTTVVESYDEARALTHSVSQSRLKGCNSREEAEKIFSASCTTPWTLAAASLASPSASSSASSSRAPRSSSSLPPSSGQSTVDDLARREKKALKKARKLARKARKARKRAAATVDSTLSDDPFASDDEPLAPHDDSPAPISQDSSVSASLDSKPVMSVDDDGEVFTRSAEAILHVIDTLQYYGSVRIIPVGLPSEG